MKTQRLRLHARPHAPQSPSLAPGRHRLNVGPGREVVLVLPRAASIENPLGLAIALHGAGGNASQRLRPLGSIAAEANVALLAPDSAGPTWDVIVGGELNDVRRIDAALEIVFAHVAIDAARIGIEGFSDGASYALTLGLENGDLFRHIFAFSPGFNAAREIVDSPRVFVSHGVFDPVLSIECSRRIVPKLRSAGLDVEYHEFQGLHVVPHRYERSAFARLAEAATA